MSYSLDNSRASWKTAKAALEVHGRIVLDDVEQAIREVDERIDGLIGLVVVTDEPDMTWDWDAVVVAGRARAYDDVKAENRESIDRVLNEILMPLPAPSLWAVSHVLSQGGASDFYMAGDSD